LTVQAMEAANLVDIPQNRTALTKALEYLKDHQLEENVPNQEDCYRQHRKGGWPFCTKDQGYMGNEGTAECIETILQLQEVYKFPELISIARLQDAIDCLLLKQNNTGGFCVYDKRIGTLDLEWLEASEFIGKSIADYDYVEVTAAVLVALAWFRKFHPEYRTAEVAAATEKGLGYIKQVQTKDGGCVATYGICFTYGAMFALEALARNGENYSTSEYSRRGCEFLISKQKEDGGWGESYLNCLKGSYIQHETSQVVQTAWACLALLEAGYPNKEPISKGIKLLMRRQQSTGHWLQESFEGAGAGYVLMISYISV